MALRHALLSSVCCNERSLEQCKKQYDNVKQRAKSKLDEIRRPKTGGGPKQKSPTPSQHLLLDGLSNRPQLVGLEVNYDTEALPTQTQTQTLSNMPMVRFIDPMTSEMVSIGENSNKAVNNPQTGIVIGATTASSTSRSKGCSTSTSISTNPTTRPKGLKRKKTDIYELEKTNIELENDVYSKKLVFLDKQIIKIDKDTIKTDLEITMLQLQQAVLLHEMQQKGIELQIQEE